MSAPKLYKYYFLDQQGNYFHVVGGDVLLTSTKTALIDSPVNWDEMSYKFGRTYPYLGITDELTAKLQFRGDGRDILDYIYNLDGYCNYDAYLKLVIEKRDDGAANTWNYNTWYEGFADFSKCNTGEDGENLTFNIEFFSDDLYQTYQANKDVEYEIPITGTDAKTLEIDGVELQGSLTWLSDSLGTATILGNSRESYIFPMGLVEDDNTDYFRELFFFKSQGYEVVDTSTTTPQDTNSFLNTNQAFTGDITLTMDFDWTTASAIPQIEVQLLLKNMKTNAVSFLNQFYVSTTTGNQTFTATYSASFLPYLYQYYIVVRAGGLLVDNDVTINSVEMNIEYNEKLPATDCQVFTQIDYAKKLIAKALEGKATLSSSFLNSSTGNYVYDYWYLYPNRVLITSGEAIRGLANPVIKGTLSELFRDLHARYGVAIDIRNGLVRIERPDYMMQRTLKIATLNNIKDVRTETAERYIYNQLTIGYPEFDAEDLNGRYEVNSQQNYKLTINNIKNSIDLTSPYKASVYEIEYLRGSIAAGKISKDDSQDNNIFLFSHNNNPVNGKYILQKFRTPDILYNVPNPDTLYNVEFAPRFRLAMHTPYLKSILNLPDTAQTTTIGKALEFTSADRNVDFKSLISGTFVEQGADYFFPSAPPPSVSRPKLFVPQFISFEAYPEVGFLDDIRNKPYGYIEAIAEDGTVYNVFVEDVEIHSGEKERYVIMGLKAPF